MTVSPESMDVAAVLEAWRHDLLGTPHPGHYKVRLRPRCPWVPAIIWLDWPRDDEGRLADRPRRLSFKLNGEWASLREWWPRLFEIDAEEYRSLVNNPPADPWSPTRSRANGH